MIFKAKWLKTLGFCLCWWEFTKQRDYSCVQTVFGGILFLPKALDILNVTEILRRERKMWPESLNLEVVLECRRIEGKDRWWCRVQIPRAPQAQCAWWGKSSWGTCAGGEPPGPQGDGLSPRLSGLSKESPHFSGLSGWLVHRQNSQESRAAGMWGSKMPVWAGYREWPVGRRAHCPRQRGYHSRRNRQRWLVAGPGVGKRESSPDPLSCFLPSGLKFKTLALLPDAPHSKAKCQKLVQSRPWWLPKGALGEHQESNCPDFSTTPCGTVPPPSLLLARPPGVGVFHGDQHPV